MANAFDAIDFSSFSNRNYDLWYTNTIVRVICVRKSFEALRITVEPIVVITNLF